MEVLFEYGFIYKEVQYGWKNKKLYRLPHVKSKRSYPLKEVPSYVFKTTTMYNIQRTKLTINRLKVLTRPIKQKVEIVDSEGCPF